MSDERGACSRIRAAVGGSARRRRPRFDPTHGNGDALPRRASTHVRGVIHLRRAGRGACAFCEVGNDRPVSPALPLQSAAATLDDDAWEKLLNFVEERRVVPIVGPELLQVETCESVIQVGIAD